MIISSINIEQKVLVTLFSISSQHQLKNKLKFLPGFGTVKIGNQNAGPYNQEESSPPLGSAPQTTSYSQLPTNRSYMAFPSNRRTLFSWLTQKALRQWFFLCMTWQE